MGGGLMQLVAYGAQDVFLTGNPQITFFKTVYRRHTNFALESIEQTFTGTADFGRKVSCTVARSGDLITKMYLRVSFDEYVASAGKWGWVSRLGHALVKEVELEIGGTRIDKQYGDWLNVWYELARNFAQDRGYDKLIGNTPEMTVLSDRHGPAVLYVPFKFFCNRHDGLAIPLIALQYHETKVNIEFRPIDECVNKTSNANLNGLRMKDASLFVDYVYLDNEERKRFAQAQHEYLIEQVQFTGQESVSGQSFKSKLLYNHPCKALYWTLRLGKYTSGRYFLAYNPHNFEKAREDASKRLVLACAEVDNNGNLVLVDNKPNLRVGVPQNLANVVNNQLVPVCLTTSPDMDNISFLGDLLTVEQMSTPVDVLLNGLTNRPNNAGSSNNDVRVYQWDNYGMNLDRSVNPVNRVLLTLNGHDRFSERDGAYFNYVQPLQHHTNTPCDGLNMYSFALNPEEHQPSGTCNFSRIDNATLTLNFNNAVAGQDNSLSVYATNYNVLRVISGMGGLAYSS
jgi:hypothetical protein